MKTFIIVSLLVVAALAAPQRDAQVLRYDNDNIGVGDYNVNFQTSNGISQQEQGQLQNAGREDEALVVRGSYSYTGDDGQVYTVNYVADQYGFQPQGAHLPQ